VADDSDDDDVERDLFGAPVRQIRERWGRPSFAKTEENQKLVAILRGKGWSQAQIATHLGCDEKTLRKHFSRELAAGGDLIEAEALQVLYTQMRRGSIPATKALLGELERGRAAPPAPKKEPVAEPLGKKAQAEAAAKAPPSGWGDLVRH